MTASTASKASAMICFAALALVALCPSVLAQNECGYWDIHCTAVGDATDDYIKSSINFDSISDGAVTYTRDIYTGDSSCSNATAHTLSIFSAGSWFDYGPNDAIKQGSRKLIMTLPFALITPGSDNQTALLTKDCPCDGTWKTGETRNLSACTKDNCDLSFLGISAPEEAQIRFGQLAFGSVYSDGTSIQLSKFSDSQTVGFEYPFDDENKFPTKSSGCTTPTAQKTFCGNSTDINYCAPVFNITGVVAAGTTLQYIGPQVTNTGKDNSDWGLYRLFTTYYSDALCRAAVVSVAQDGTMGLQTAQHVTDATYVSMYPSTTRVTPATADAATALGTDCPCGGAWKAGVTRLLHVCPNSCPTPWFSGGVGVPLYSTIKVQVNTQAASYDNYELRMTRPSMDGQAVAKAQFAPSDFAMEYDPSTCPALNVSSRLCGNWTRPCIADYTGVNDNEYSSKIAITQGSNSTGGALFRSTSVYKGGSQCAASGFVSKVDLYGYWTLRGLSAQVQGAREITLNIPRIEATIADAALVDDLNQNCPCDGTWVLNKPRTLTTCTPANCPKPGALCYGNPGCDAGSIGNAGYGLLRVEEDVTDTIYKEWLRLSSFLDSDQGYSVGFTQTSNAYTRASVCSIPAPKKKVPCGTWEQPCFEDPRSDNDFRTSFTLHKDDQYSMSTMYYKPSHACASNASYLIVEQQGQYMTSYKTPPMASSNQPFSLKPNFIKVTPMTDDAATQMNADCSCDKIWTKGQPIWLTEPCNTCKIFWLRQPIGKQGYGNILIEGNSFQSSVRVTELVDDPDQGALVVLKGSDYPWWLADSAGCASASNKKSGGLEGGGIALLVFFFGLFGYFAVGMVLNYRSVGSPVIPHAEFWKELPSLIWEGINFSICGCCGTKSSGVSYQKASFEGTSTGSSGGYGSL